MLKFTMPHLDKLSDILTRGASDELRELLSSVYFSKDVLNNKFMWAIANEQLTCAEVLLERGANLSYKMPLGENALMIAAKKGLERSALFLVDHGIPLDEVHPLSGKTALMFAAEAQDGTTGVFHLLVTRGANTELKDQDERTAFDMLHAGTNLSFRP